jgi:glycosyltransferase involved in cell wall biosynthesis
VPSGHREVSVVTATWNEVETLAALIEGIRQTLGRAAHEVIVVDDSSPDGTYSLASKLADRAIRKKREGQSIDLLTGIREAKYPLVVTIDADLENDSANIPKLLEKLADGYGLVVASRPQLPRWSERLFAATVGRTHGIRDVLSNFRAMRADKVKGISLDHGETFGAEFLIKAHKLGLRLGEIQVDATARRHRAIHIALTKERLTNQSSLSHLCLSMLGTSWFSSRTRCAFCFDESAWVDVGGWLGYSPEHYDLALGDGLNLSWYGPRFPND